MNRFYLVISSDILSPDIIKEAINDKPSKIIRKGDEKKYNDSLYDYNSVEYSFIEKDQISKILTSVISFIDNNLQAINNLKLIDKDLYLSLKFVIKLDNKTTPDFFFDTKFIESLYSIKANFDIDMYYQ